MVKTFCVLCGGLSIVLPLLVGCNQKAKPHDANRETASGIVTLDGKPIGGGSVTLISVKDPTCRMTAMIRPDGHFSVANAPSGEVKIGVNTEIAKIGNPAGYVKIPEKYSNPEKRRG